jgi:probable HAF family extracellular repeat protein
MRHPPTVLSALAVAICAASAVPAPAYAAAVFEPMGRFWVAGVSDDGNVVAGTWNDPALGPGQVMSLWTPSGGLRTAGFAPNSEHTTAHAISGDGSTILGVDYNAQMLTWTAAGGVQYPPGTGGFPGGISRDGSVLTGGVGNAPFRWTRSGGAVALPVPAEWSSDGRGNAVSADGSVVAGTLFNAPGQRRAFRWTSAGGTALLDLPAGIVGSDATAVSDNGSTVVGWSYDANDVQHAFRWTTAGGSQLLGHLPGFPNTPAPTATSSATDVTADGSIVVGFDSAGPLLGDGGAFIWDAAHGMRGLKDVLTGDYGLDLSGWTLWSADGITPDGTTIVGMGSHPDLGESVAWRVVLPEPGASALLLGTPVLLLRRTRRA